MNSIESTADVYNKIANEFDNSRHYKWPWITEFINSINKNSSHKILDIGCGNGRNIIGYKTNNLIIEGIDNSIEFVKICKKKNLDVILADMTNIPKDNESFDYILSIASFHHLNILEARISCLKEMHRILKQNGKILLSVWSKMQPKKTKRIFENYGDQLVSWKCKNGQLYDRYYYIFKISEIKTLFEENGFKIINHKWDCGNEIFELQKI